MVKVKRNTAYGLNPADVERKARVAGRGDSLVPGGDALGACDALRRAIRPGRLSLAEGQAQGDKEEPAGARGHARGKDACHEQSGHAQAGARRAAGRR